VSGKHGAGSRAGAPPLTVRALAEAAERQGVHPDVRDIEAVLGTVNDLVDEVARLDAGLSTGIVEP
jgi:hypothetical protein